MEQIAINILPKGAKPVCHSSQFDEGRQIRFNLFNDATPYTLSGTETISVLVRKPDGAEVVDSVTNTSDNYVIWDVSADACELSGVCECELSIVENGIVLGSKNFTMKVEEDAYGGKNIEVRTASGRIATFNTNIVDAFKSLKSDINPVQDLHGYSKPWSGGAGKNKLNYDAWKTLKGVARGTVVFENNGVKITATGNDAYTDFSNTGFPVNARVPVTEGETITLSWQETTNKSGTVIIFPNGQPSGYVSINNAVAKKLSYTVPSGVAYISFRFGVATSGDTIAYKNIQIEKGSQATSWEPYSNICPISGFSALNVTRTGKNLFDNSLMVNSRTTVVGDTVTLTATGNFQGSEFAFMPVKQGYKYALNIDSLTSGSAIEVRRYDASGTVTNTISITQSTIINIDDGTTVRISIVYGNRLAGAGTFFLKGFNIALGKNYQSYTPYNGQTKTVNFGQTVYGGVADVTGGKVNVTHALTPLNNKTWVKSGNKFYTSGFDNAPAGVLYTDNFNCAIGTPANKEWNALAVGECCLRNGLYSTNKWSFVYCTDAYATVEEFVSALNADCTITYLLATPIEISTTPENLTAISGENNVFSDTNGDTTVEYYIEV